MDILWQWADAVILDMLSTTPTETYLHNKFANEMM